MRKSIPGSSTLIIIIIVLAIPLLGSGCSGGGHVDLKGETHTQTLQPIIQSVRSTLAADEALKSIFTAEDETARLKAIDKIRQDDPPSFDWERFWTVARGAADTINRDFSAEARTRLIRLHDVSCLETNFKRFAEFTLALDAGYEYLAGARRCRAQLDTALTAKLASALARKYEIAASPADRAQTATLLAGLVSAEYRGGTLAAWDAVFKGIARETWTTVLDTLADENREALLDLLSAMTALDDDGTYSEAILSSLLRSGAENLERFVRKPKSFAIFLELLADADPARLRALSKSETTKILRVLAGAFRPATLAADAMARWEDAWGRLVTLRRTQRLLARNHPTPEAVSWLESLHASLEADFASDRERAREFVTGPRFRGSDWPLDRAWLKLRVLGKDGALDSGVNFRTAEPTLALDRILQARLNARFANGHAETHQAIIAYCATMEAVGLAGDTRDASMLAASFEETLEPGCHYIRSPSATSAAITIDRSGRDVLMAADAVLIAPGLDLTLTARSFDGSFIDLTADRTHEPRPVDATPVDYDAVVFPFVLGIRTDARVTGFEKGVYFIPMNFVYREAKPGPRADAELLAGFAAGVLTVKAAMAPLPPAFSALGGIGQRFSADTRAGGKGAESSFVNDSIDDWFLTLRANAPQEISNDRLRLLKEPRHFELWALINTVAKDEHGAPIVYVNPSYRAALDGEYEKPLTTACTAHGLPVGDDCFRILGQKAFNTIVSSVTNLDPVVHRNRVLDFFLQGLSVPAGAAQTITRTGAAGSDGKLEETL